MAEKIPIEAKDTVMTGYEASQIAKVFPEGVTGRVFLSIANRQAEISFKAGIEKGRQQIINHIEKYFKNAKITAFTGEGGFTQIIMPNEDFEALKEGKDV